MTNLIPAPTTYGQAIKTAKPVTVEELTKLLYANPGVTILRPRCPRRHATILDVRPNDHGLVCRYEYCDRNGYARTDYLVVARRTRVALDFYGIGEVVAHGWEAGR